MKASSRAWRAGLLTLDLEGRLTSLNRGGRGHSGLGRPKRPWDCLLRRLWVLKKPPLLLGKTGKQGSIRYSREIDITTRQGQSVVIGFTSTTGSIISVKKWEPFYPFGISPSSSRCSPR